MKHGKKYNESLARIDREKFYELDEALKILQDSAQPKFDQSVDIAMNLGVDPRHADQNVRGTVSLPHGTGKDIRVLVFAKGEELIAAQEAGADYAGADDMVTKVKGGWLDFDAVVATPDMMREVGKLGSILGPRKLMPSPKAGTVTKEVAKAVGELKAGKIEYRVDKNGIVHAAIGRISFSIEQLHENLKALMDAILRARPASVKGAYLEKISISSTMGPGIKIDKSTFA